jgi:hypothetical protein
MQQASGDFSFFFKRIMEVATGISGSLVDNRIHARDRKFKDETTHVTQGQFDTKPDKNNPLLFYWIANWRIQIMPTILQDRYFERLSLLPKSCDFQMFRSILAKILWVSNSRPDICCVVAFSSQVSPSTFTSESYKSLNKAIKHLKASKDLVLQFLRHEIANI